MNEELQLMFFFHFLFVSKSLKITKIRSKSYGIDRRFVEDLPKLIKDSLKIFQGLLEIFQDWLKIFQDWLKIFQDWLKIR